MTAHALTAHSPFGNRDSWNGKPQFRCLMAMPQFDNRDRNQRTPVVAIQQIRSIHATVPAQTTTILLAGLGVAGGALALQQVAKVVWCARVAVF